MIEKARLMIESGDHRFQGEFRKSSVPAEHLAIIPDRLKYAVGGKADVTVKVLTKPQSSEVEVVGVLKKNGEEQYPVEDEDGVARYQIPMKTPGIVTLEAQAYRQQKRLARGLQEAIKAYRAERDEIRNRLEDGVDSETRVELERRLAEVESNLVFLKEELKKARTPFGSPVREEVYVE